MIFGHFYDNDDGDVVIMVIIKGSSARPVQLASSPARQAEWPVPQQRRQWGQAAAQKHSGARAYKMLNLQHMASQ